MTFDSLLALALAHKWVAVASVVIGALVRLAKSDTVLPIDVPAKWRPLFAMGLGVVSGVLEHVAAGTSWRDAVLGGVVSAVLAILGHEWVVERLLGDRAMPIPGLTRRSSARLSEPKKENPS